MSSIYFVQAGPGGPVKIGFSTDPAFRIHELDKNSPVPLTVLALLPGGVAFEHRLHRRFKHLRIRGEWFRGEPELLDFCVMQNIGSLFRKPVKKPRPVPADAWTLSEIKELTALFGGFFSFAEKLSVRPNVPYNWVKRGTPVVQRRRIAALAKSEGIRLPEWFARSPSLDEAA